MPIEQFDRECPEMFFEAGPPTRVDFIPRLQDTAFFLRIAATNKTCVPPMFAGQQMNYRSGFPMSAHAQDDPVIGPVHRQRP